MKKKKKNPNWTEELFTISSVKATKPPTYTIEDLRGEPVEGSFYEAELQKSTQEVFRIDKVIKRRTTKRGKEEALVSWKGYDSSFNSWVAISELHKL